MTDGTTPPFVIRARRTLEERCSICHGGIGASAIACIACQTLAHEDCLAGHGRCPTLGCRGATPAERLLVAPAVRAWTRLAWLRRRLWAALLLRTALNTLGIFPVFATGMLALSSAHASSPLDGSCVCLPLAPVCLFWLDALRRRHNRLRMLLTIDRPVLMRAFRQDSFFGGSVLLSAVGPTDRDRRTPLVVARVPLDLLSPAWLRNGPATRSLLVHGLADRGDRLILESATGDGTEAAVVTFGVP